jgi:D-alanine-D-alanine ligase
MDKDVTKRLLKDACIQIADFLTFSTHEKSYIKFNAIVERLCLPFFIKPANLDSSVGISKVKSEYQFSNTIEEAFN